MRYTICDNDSGSVVRVSVTILTYMEVYSLFYITDMSPHRDIFIMSLALVLVNYGTTKQTCYNQKINEENILKNGENIGKLLNRTDLEKRFRQ